MDQVVPKYSRSMEYRVKLKSCPNSEYDAWSAFVNGEYRAAPPGSFLELRQQLPPGIISISSK